MSLPNEVISALLGGSAAAGGYQISRSLRFNSADSAYLNRTPGTAGNRKTWTWAGWVKRTDQATSVRTLFIGEGGTSNTTYARLIFSYPNKLYFGPYSGWWRITNQVFRDPSAWYHVLLAVDTTQSTANDRIRLYLNGTEITEFSTLTNPTQNDDTGINNNVFHGIGADSGGSYYDGYLADIHFIDGQALDPSSFGEYDTNNVWQPIDASGLTFGTNGFHLDFADNSTAAALGTDTSSNGNTWTVNNISVAAGVGNDSLVDTPTNYGTDTGAGGEVRGNYCTLNPLSKGGHPLSNGNLNYGISASGWDTCLSTFGMSSGKWYWEQTYISGGANCMAGFGNTQTSLASYPASPNSTGYDFVNGVIYGAGAGVPAGATLSAGDIMGISVDVDTGEAKFYKNGVLQTTLSHGITGTLLPLVSSYDGVGCLNFGQRPWAYAAPAGFKALCTTNLPAPTIENGSTVFDTKLYTGNGSTQTISGLNFSPDWVWIKSRSAATDHALYDVVRGTQARLESNRTDAEATSDSGLTAFNNDGFALSTLAQVNTSSATYVAWTWDGGTSTVTNTSGSISSQVRANASAGFSVVTWTGNGVGGATIGHGLNVAPSMIIIKQRDQTDNWVVGHTTQGWSSVGFLNLTNAWGVISYFNNQAPTSTAFYLSGSAVVNGSGYQFVAYCFAPVAGYSSFGSYTGNGSVDGPFVYTGFRSRFLLIKCSNGGFSWQLLDTARSDYNQANAILLPNDSSSELTYNGVDFLSNGFKLRGTSSNLNGSANTYVYYAAAEHPFAYARAR